MTRTTDKNASGAGLVLSRYRGERIMIKANQKATDQEILDAIRNEGIVVTLVDMFDYRHPNHKTTRRVAKVGIRASNHLSIAREEIINRERAVKDSTDGNIQAEGDAQSA
ncbi:hypothetical protein P5704_025575 (plasmid) [Pseudomonas sp. FeN3W]|nr:hypothetical protein P5704_025575 [Pseudomonas sp. FeN3W]